MTKSTEDLKRMIAAAGKREQVDLVIKNGKVINVFTSEIMDVDVAISNGFIVGLGEYEGKKVIDARGKFICPGFIDGHIHIESSMVQPSEFARVVLPHGVTTIITDPHEIGNVSGSTGIQFMLDDSEKIPLDVFFMLPSCVPTTEFENTGAALHAEQLAPFYEQDRVLGLGEVMNYPAVFHGEDAMIQKLYDAARFQKIIDGHAAGVAAEGINVYMAAGIRTDHECNTAEEALERVRRGMYVMIREGTASKDLRKIVTAVNDKNARRFLFVTDDKHLDELINEGSIDHNVRYAIELGLDPMLAIQMATLNAAECFSLTTKGAIAPGYEADFLLLDSLEAVSIDEVYKAGKLVAKNGSCLPFKVPDVNKSAVMDSVNVDTVAKEMLEIELNENEKANIIEIIPNQIVTNHLVERVPVADGKFTQSVDDDLLKLAVVERHHAKENIGLGIVKGFQISSGAIVSTVAHDSHNIVVAGTNDDDMLVAINEVTKLGGGKAIIKDGKRLASIPLPISGLMSVRNYETVYHELKELNRALKIIGFNGSFNPFSTLAFLSLPVIPHLKLTDLGLFNVDEFKHVLISE